MTWPTRNVYHDDNAYYTNAQEYPLPTSFADKYVIQDGSDINQQPCDVNRGSDILRQCQNYSHTSYYNCNPTYQSQYKYDWEHNFMEDEDEDDLDQVEIEFEEKIQRHTTTSVPIQRNVL